MDCKCSEAAADKIYKEIEKVMDQGHSVSCIRNDNDFRLAFVLFAARKKMNVFFCYFIYF